jgi:hypothetical protein
MKLKIPVQKLGGSVSGQNLVLLCFIYGNKLPIVLMQGLCSSNDRLHCYSENGAMLWCDFNSFELLNMIFIVLQKVVQLESHTFFALDTSIYSQSLIHSTGKKFSSTASRPELGPTKSPI